MSTNLPASQYHIWPNHPADRQFQTNRPFVRGFEHCPRAGGPYISSDEAIDMIHSPTGISLDEGSKNQLRARLTTILVDQRRVGIRLPEVTRGLVAEAMLKRPLSVGHRAERLLSYLAYKTGNIGQFINLYRDIIDGEAPRDSAGRLIHYPLPINSDLLEAMAWSESITYEEVLYLVRYLNENQWIREEQQQSYKFQLTVDGHSRLAELQSAPLSSQAFVAMWINDETNEAFEKGLRLGIEDAGYKAQRIDKKEDVVKIDDEIMSEIRRSRLLVADFTHGASGVRGGVYFEAGFAEGLGIPVIYTCRSNMVKELHFDTRQYAHILWNDSEGLRVAIRDRIRARLGQGPGAN